MVPGRRRRAAAAALTALTLLLAGCAQIPTNGPVQSGRRGGEIDAGEQPVQVFAQRPQKGWQPSQIVSGFLAAMASPENDHAVARSYLTPDIRGSWPTSEGPSVVVYARDDDFRLEAGRDNTVKVSATEIATITQRDEYRPSEVGASTQAVFRLQRVDGEWRIGSLPGSLLLNENDIKSYEQFDLFFYAKDADVFVPDPIVLPPTDPELWPRELLERLLRGPTPSTAPGVRTAIPRGTTLDAPPMLEDDGTLTVELGGAASNVTGQDRRRLVAQISATLLRGRGVSRVRIDVGGEKDVTQDASAFAAYDPTRAVENLRGYFVRDDKLVGVNTANGNIQQLAGPFGTGAVDFIRPAVSLDGKNAAAVSTDERSLWVGPADSKGKAVQVYAGTRLSTPSWDRNGDLWVVDNTSSGARLLRFSDGKGKPQQVSAPGLDGLDVSSMKVAWDGVRVAFAASGGKGGHVLTGILDRRGNGVTLRAMLPVAPTLADVDDVWWYDRRSLAVAGSEQSDLRASYEVSIDGLSLRKVSTVSDLSGIAAAAGMPLLVSDASGKIAIAQPDEFRYDRVGDGSYPTYPG